MLAKRFVLVLVGLASLADGSFGAATEPPPQFVTMWPTPGPMEGIAVDAAGYVYGASPFTGIVYKFTDVGQPVLSWGTPGSLPGQFSGPYFAAVDALGHIFVEDPGNHRVEVFTSDGAFIREFGSGELGEFLGDLVVGPAGNVFVAEYGKSRVVEYDSSGSLLRVLGFGHPVGVALDAAGELFVSDSENDVIHKFDAAGGLLLTFGGPGGEPGQLNGPVGLATDGAGDVYVADYGNNRIQKFSAGGSLLSYWGTSGTGPGQFGRPTDVAIGPDGAVYVTEYGNSRVQKFAYAPVNTVAATWGQLKKRYRQ